MPSTAAIAATASLCLLAASPANATDDWTIMRVGGNTSVETELKPDGYRAGVCMVEESLPVGYPAPTPPGAIELKRYPTVRRAEVSGDSAPQRGSIDGFWPLFQHIQSRGIAMTSPVEMEFAEDDAADQPQWTMAFLYRDADRGPLGRDGRVRVVDADALTVVSIGVAGPYGPRIVEPGVSALETWLDGQSEWIRAGAPRALYYNGPSVPNQRKWGEVQIPIRRSPVAVSDRATPSNRPLEQLRDPLSGAELIELAVQRGSSLFNAGQTEACAAVYEVAAESLLRETGLDTGVRRTLLTSLREARAQHDMRERAWTLRRALDSAWRMLQTDARWSEAANTDTGILWTDDA